MVEENTCPRQVISAEKEERNPVDTATGVMFSMTRDALSSVTREQSMGWVLA